MLAIELLALMNFAEILIEILAWTTGEIDLIMNRFEIEAETANPDRSRARSPNHSADGLVLLYSCSWVKTALTNWQV